MSPRGQRTDEATVYCHEMHGEIAPFQYVADHVPAATGDDVVPYVAAVALWLIGVVLLIARKIRAA